MLARSLPHGQRNVAAIGSRGRPFQDDPVSGPRYTALTGIRGAAAAWVVAFHAYPFVGSLMAWPERGQVPVIREGFLAVDLFFMLSGFVLSNASAQQFETNLGRNFGAFLAARARRIFPLHWVCLGIVILLVKAFPNHWWGPGPFSSRALVASAFLIQNWISSTAQAWNHPAWSLSAEWLAYLLFPVMAFAIRFVDNRAYAAVGAALFLLVLEILLLSTGATSLDHVGRGGLARCLCEFLSGALIWRATRDAASNTIFGSGNLWIILSVVLVSVALLAPSLQILAPFGFAMLIIGCVFPSKVGSWLFGNRLLIWLGEISFSVYLIHAPILASFTLAADWLQFRSAGLLARLSLLVAIPALVLATAVVLRRFVEVPGRSFMKLPVDPEPWEIAHQRASVRITFWLMLVIAMTLSETAADFISGTVALGYSLSTTLLVTAAASILIAQINAGRCNYVLDWGLVLCISMAGTTLSDFLDISAGLGDPGATIVLVLTLVSARGVWQWTLTRRVRRFDWQAEAMVNWFTVLFAAALCTSLGDLLSDHLGMREPGGALVPIGCLACIVLTALCTRLPFRILFWASFVLIRPLGVMFGDALSKSHADGGLQFGPGASSLILAAAMIVLIPFAGPQFVGLVRRLHGRPTQTLA